MGEATLALDPHQMIRPDPQGARLLDETLRRRCQLEQLVLKERSESSVLGAVVEKYISDSANQTCHPHLYAHAAHSSYL